MSETEHFKRKLYYSLFHVLSLSQLYRDKKYTSKYYNQLQ